MVFSIQQLHLLRGRELEKVLPELPLRGTILEVGAGTGRQALALQELGYRVIAIDLPASSYAGERVHPVVEYDGRRLPVDSGTIDVVFSSNVLEHIDDLAALHQEIRRVLSGDGFCIHLMPTPTWRLWTFIAGWLDVIPALHHWAKHRDSPQRRGVARLVGGHVLPVRHGVRGTAFSELWTFSEAHWRRLFEKLGFKVERTLPVGLFYTGFMFLGARLSLSQRNSLARWLGSACRIYVVRPEDSKSD